MDKEEKAIGTGLVSVLLLFVAGIGAGVIGSTAGLASLVSYPVLLAFGLPPVTANVTNTVALIGSSVGSVGNSRHELRGQRPDLLLWLPIAGCGGALGATLLLLGPAGNFEAIVPYLVALASVLLAFSPRLRTLGTRRRGPGHPGTIPADADQAIGHPPRRKLLAAGLFCVCIYGGYFGAAAGVMILAMLLSSTAKPFPAANAAKNFVLGVANGVAAIGFTIFADVRWAAAVPLGLGCVVGGALGPAVARQVPATVMRVVISCAGMGLAVKLWLS